MNIIDIIAGPIFKIIDKLVPDPQAKAQAQLEVIKLQQAGEFKELEAAVAIAQGQTEINKIEAASDNVFKSGWRPAVGWVCVIGLLYTYLFQPLLSWMSLTRGWAVPPSLELGDLIILLGGMLGLGTLRTTEKIKGVS